MTSALASFVEVPPYADDAYQRLIRDVPELAALAGPEEFTAERWLVSIVCFWCRSTMWSICNPGVTLVDLAKKVHADADLQAAISAAHQSNGQPFATLTMVQEWTT